jgi:hypothetical protein
MRGSKTVSKTVTAATLGVTLACFGVAGCGGGSSDNGVAAKSATNILTASKAAVKKQGSFHIAGTGSNGTQAFAIDLRVDIKSGNTTGSFTLNSQTVKVIRDGDSIYVKAPAAFYKAQGLGDAQAAIVDNKWLKQPASSPNFSQIVSFADIDALLTPSGTVTKGSKSTVDGAKVIALSSSDGTLYVHTTGDPVPFEIVPNGSSKSSGKITFTDFGTPVSVSAPPNAIDASKLGGG